MTLLYIKLKSFSTEDQFIDLSGSLSGSLDGSVILYYVEEMGVICLQEVPIRPQIFSTLFWLWNVYTINDRAVLSLTLSHCRITSLWHDGRLPGVNASVFGTSMSDSGSQSQTLIGADKLHE